MTQKSLLDTASYEACVNRIERLNSDAQPEWGSMTAGQMLAHCAEIQEVNNGKNLKNTPFIAKLFKGMIRKMVLDSSEYPKNSKTHPQYVQYGEKDFDQEKSRLLIAIKTFHEMDTTQLAQKHPFFGTMSPEEKGWAMYKHLDHHLNQFNV